MRRRWGATPQVLRVDHEFPALIDERRYTSCASEARSISSNDARRNSLSS
jgi:hypothetical protein